MAQTSEYQRVTSAAELLRRYAAGERDFHAANLGDTDLRGANLTDANLRDAYLRGANLTDANLRDAYLLRANLGGANLTDANLLRADLRGANLLRADLRGANLPDSPALAPIRADIERVCASAPHEVAGLLAALEAGRVDGTVYEGECACLVGTVANLRGCVYTGMPDLRPDSASLAERWALGIAAGDTPESNPVARLTAEWLRAWLAESERSNDDGADK